MSPTVGDNTASRILALMQLVHQHRRPPIIYVATQLGLADMVADHSRTLMKLTELTDTRVPSLYRLLLALAHIGAFIGRVALIIGRSPLWNTEGRIGGFGHVHKK
jgi:hypothetical protein